MNNIEFLKFQETPTEKHLGIATIRYEKRWILRFKINLNPKGEGYFSNAPSVKVDDSYYPAFSLDSSYESDELRKFVLNGVKEHLSHMEQKKVDQPIPLVYFPTEEQKQFNYEQNQFEQAPF